MAIIFTTFGIYFLLAIISVTFVFVLAMAKQDNSIMDIAYGPVYLMATFFTIFLTHSYGITPSIVCTLVALWSARLCLRIFHKNFRKPEDARYAAWRNEWLKKGELYFIFRSYLQIFLLQGIIITLVSLPIIIVISNPLSFNIWFVLVGAFISLFGLGIETLADSQLDTFIKNKISGTEKANLMTTGLFKYSRRPNYFGETLVWWGLFIIALPMPFGYLAILSPLLITYIVTKITGPMLEKIFIEKYGQEYREYQSKTSYFIPLPKKQ